MINVYRNKALWLYAYHLQIFRNCKVTYNLKPLAVGIFLAISMYQVRRGPIEPESNNYSCVVTVRSITA